MKNKIISILCCIGFVVNCFGIGDGGFSSNKKILSAIAALGAVASGVVIYQKYRAYQIQKNERAQRIQAHRDFLQTALARSEIKRLQNNGGQIEGDMLSPSSSSSSSSSSLSSSHSARVYIPTYSQQSLGDASDVQQTLTEKRTFYLKVAGQEVEGNPTNKCGYMALSNALGIQTLLKDNKILSVENIDEQSSLPIKDEEIECLELVNLAKEYKVSNLYITASGKGFRDGLYMAAAQTDDTKGDLLLNSFKNKMVEPGNYLQFINNTGGHWVLALVIKVDNQKPVILFMNTKNSPLTANSNAYRFLQGLWKFIDQ